MKKIAIYMMFLAIPFSSIQTQTVERLIVYKEFFKAGSSVGILNLFMNPMKYIDTTNINKKNLFISEFSDILGQAKQRKHIQQKIVEITIAGEFYVGNEKHFFIYVPNKVIDITTMREYIITNNTMRKRLNSWILELDTQQKDRM